MAPKSEVDEMSLHKLKIVLESVRQERDEQVLKVARLEEKVARLKEDLAKCQFGFFISPYFSGTPAAALRGPGG